MKDQDTSIAKSNKLTALTDCMASAFDTMQMKDQITKTAIAANLAALADRLAQAADLAAQAQETMSKGNQNGAIGTILQIERTLPEALSLFNATLALHQSKR